MTLTTTILVGKIRVPKNARPPLARPVGTPLSWHVCLISLPSRKDPDGGVQFHYALSVEGHLLQRVCIPTVKPVGISDFGWTLYEPYPDCPTPDMWLTKLRTRGFVDDPADVVK